MEKVYLTITSEPYGANPGTATCPEISNEDDYQICLEVANKVFDNMNVLVDGVHTYTVYDGGETATEVYCELSKDKIEMYRRLRALGHTVSFKFDYSTGVETPITSYNVTIPIKDDDVIIPSWGNLAYIGEIDVDITERNDLQVIHVNQFDNLTTYFNVNLYRQGQAYTPTVTDYIQCTGTKGDGKAFCNELCEQSGASVKVAVTSDMTAVAGKIATELIFFDAEKKQLGTGNFLLIVEKAGVSNDADISATESDPYYIKTAAEEAKAAKEDAETAAEEAANDADRAEAAADEAEAWSKNPPYIGDNGNWWVYDIDTEVFVDSGIDASITLQIADVTMLPTEDTPAVTNTGTSTDAVFHLYIPRGETGLTGNGIQSIEKISSVGLVDTYRITYTNGTTTDYTVTNGADGAGSVSTVDGVSPIGGNVTIPIFVGATNNSAGVKGEVPAPAAGQTNLFLCSDGTWKEAEGGTTIVQPPVATEQSYTYNGSEQSFAFDSIDLTHCIVTNGEQTNAGTYTVTVALKSASYVWNDLTTADKTFTWTIAKAASSISVSPASITLDADNLTATLVPTTTGDGAVSYSGYDADIITIVGNVVTATQESGSTTITATIAATTNYNEASTTISVTADFGVEMVSWSAGTDEEIAAMVEAFYADQITLAQVQEYWHVGDVREMSISAIETTGTANGFTWSVGESHHAQTVDVVILGFEHDDLTTAENGHTKALVSVGMKNCLYMGANKPTSSNVDGLSNTENGYMNSTITNMTGWTNSARRQWCNGGFYSAMPSEIKNEVKQVQKITEKNPNDEKITDDYVFLPSEWEIFGATTHAKAQEGTQYSYYTTAANRYKYPKWNSSYVSDFWWERSPRGSDSTYFCYVAGGGNASANDASSTRGLAPAWTM